MNKPSTVPDFNDDLPDFSTPEWQAKFADAPVEHGRPKADVTKIVTKTPSRSRRSRRFPRQRSRLAKPYQRSAPESCRPVITLPTPAKHQKVRGVGRCAQEGKFTQSYPDLTPADTEVHAQVAIAA